MHSTVSTGGGARLESRVPERHRRGACVSERRECDWHELWIGGIESKPGALTKGIQHRRDKGANPRGFYPQGSVWWKS